MRCRSLLLCSAVSDSSRAMVQASVSMEFSRQKYCSGLPFPPPGDLAHPGIELTLPNLLCWQVDSLPLRHLLAESKSDPITTLFRVFCYCCKKKKKKKKKSAKNFLKNSAKKKISKQHLLPIFDKNMNPASTIKIKFISPTSRRKSLPWSNKSHSH